MTTKARSERLKQIHARAGGPSARGSRVVRHAVDDGTPGAGDERSAELWLYGVVGAFWYGFNAATVADQLRGLDVDHITVRLHSPGGDAWDGIAIGSLLRNHKAKVTVVVDGLAASAASVIAIAGDDVVMSPGSQFMIHDPWIFTIGDAAELRADADFLDQQADNIATVYALRGGGTAAQWREVMVAEAWYSADEAVTAGLADRVGTVTTTGTAPEQPSTDPDEALDEDEVAALAAWDLEALVHPAARAAWRGPQPPPASAAGTPEKKGAALVDLTPEQINSLRQQVGFPENADATTIVSATLEALAENATDTPTAGTAPVPPGMTLIEEAVLNGLRDQATRGAQARQQQLDEHRDRVINQAIADGKTTPARREHWVASWAADPEGTEQSIDALAAGLVPVEEQGHDLHSTQANSAYDDLYGQKGA